MPTDPKPPRIHNPDNSKKSLQEMANESNGGPRGCRHCGGTLTHKEAGRGVVCSHCWRPRHG